MDISAIQLQGHRGRHGGTHFRLLCFFSFRSLLPSRCLDFLWRLWSCETQRRAPVKQCGGASENACVMSAHDTHSAAPAAQKDRHSAAGAPACHCCSL